MTDLTVVVTVARGREFPLEMMHKSHSFVGSSPEAAASDNPLAGWQAEGFRLSFIGVSEWSQRPIFRDISGVEPALVTAQRMVQLHQEAGEVGHAHLNVVQQANRIDITIGDKPTQNTVDPSLPGYKPFFSAGPFHETLQLFDDLTSKAAPLLKNALRVAYAITLLQPTPNARQSGRLLHRFLPKVPMDPEKDIDLIFQINRPHVREGGLLINRLGRWESVQITTVRVLASGGPMPVMPAASPITAAQIYVEANTDAENTVPLTNLPDLVQELRNAAVKLAEVGDV
ncbi:hypothetical protein ABH973_006745 [Bradyrhizobium ottawaense]|uniref:hypothetical protein n=1 Tax=Bradyrhizobium ottawaense TaxID=931866 RepID=UPI0035141672